MMASRRAQLSGEGPLPVVYALGRGRFVDELLSEESVGDPEPIAQAKRGVLWTVYG